MTKQEEIRAGTIEFWRDAGEKLTRARTTELTDVYFRWLADKGVVIKVDRELPVSIPVLPKFHKQGIITDDDLLEYARFTEVLNRKEYIKAGFEAVETIAPSDAGMSR